MKRLLATLVIAAGAVSLTACNHTTKPAIRISTPITATQQAARMPKATTTTVAPAPVTTVPEVPTTVAPTTSTTVSATTSTTVTTVTTVPCCVASDGTPWTKAWADDARAQHAAGIPWCQDTDYYDPTPGATVPEGEVCVNRPLEDF